MAEVLDRATYIVSLQKLHGFIRGWELWADIIEDHTVKDVLSKRRRSSLLVADLSYFTADVSTSVYTGPLLDRSKRSSILGAIYVVEGSTLGGQYIARHVEHALCLTPGMGDSYFRGYKEQTGSMWAEVQAMLLQAPEQDSEIVIDAASSVFQDFRAWMTVGDALWEERAK